MNEYTLGRRQLLGAAAGVFGTVGLTGTAGAQPEPGAVVWSFDTSDPVTMSSPTIVDGTAYVGCGNDDIDTGGSVWAVDAETGEEQRRFEDSTSSYTISSSPTVADGIVYFGYENDTLYALAAGGDGSSDGSRAMLGALGHHDGWAYAGQTIEIDPVTDQSDEESDDGSDGDDGSESDDDSGGGGATSGGDGPGFGVGGAVAALGTAGYLLRRDGDGTDDAE